MLRSAKIIQSISQCGIQGADVLSLWKAMTTGGAVVVIPPIAFRVGMPQGRENFHRLLKMVYV
jgi:hypothetical protein